MITNSGSQRFDIYSGPFNKNDQLTASPFADSFLYVPNITFSVAMQVLPTLNNAGANNRRALGALEEREREAYSLGYVDTRYMEWLEDMDRRHVNERRAAAKKTLGYVTHDVCAHF
jgi:NAD nucleotidase, C-terminal domain